MIFYEDMEPIQDLLNRIRWDEEFGRAFFEIGYYDRIEDRIIRVAFQEVEFGKGDKTTFRLTGPNGEIFSIPLHRVRQVFRDKELIWERP